MIFDMLKIMWKIASNDGLHRIVRTCLLFGILAVLYHGVKELKVVELTVQRVAMVEKKIDKALWRVDTGLMMVQNAFDDRDMKKK